VARASFGIACFNFGLDRSKVSAMTGEEYVAALAECLESFPSITRVEIDWDDSFEISGDLLDVIEEPGQAFHPYPIPANVNLELYIPFRLQSSLIDIEEEFLETFTETFRISIVSAYYHNVTFVEPVAPTKEANPWDAVRIVREFLKSQFELLLPEPFIFEILGPSPFHSHCFIMPSANLGDLSLKAEKIIEAGSKTLLFMYDPDMMDFEEARAEIFRQASTEMALFYNNIATRNQQNLVWRVILELVRKLSSINRLPWWKRSVKMLLGHSRHLFAAYSAITSFEMDRLYSEWSRHNDYSHVYVDCENPFFKSEIDSTFEEEFDYSIKNLSDLLGFAETRRAQSVQVAFLILAAVVGGVVGALVTLLMK